MYHDKASVCFYGAGKIGVFSAVIPGLLQFVEKKQENPESRGSDRANDSGCLAH